MTKANLDTLGLLAQRMEDHQVLAVGKLDAAVVRLAIDEIAQSRGRIEFMQDWFASRLEMLRQLIQSDALHIYDEVLKIMHAGQEGFANAKASPPAFDRLANLEALLGVSERRTKQWQDLATKYEELSNARGEAIDKFREKKVQLEADAYRFYLLRCMLQEAGCPWPEDCHIPTVVGGWLKQMQSASVRPLPPSKEA